VPPGAATAAETFAGAVRTDVGDGGTVVVTTGDAEVAGGLVAVVGGGAGELVGVDGAGAVVVGEGVAAVTLTTEKPETPFPVTWPGLVSPAKPYSGDPS